MAVTVEQLKAKVEAIDMSEPIRRSHIEDCLDFLILVERADNPFNHEPTLNLCYSVIYKYGQQINAQGGFKKMQDEFYWFSNSFKYRLTAEVSYIVRSTLEDDWDGIGEWRA